MCVEVHVIYELFYTLCMSQEGLQNLKKYFSADEPNIHDPFFMAQFLIIPTNTIVKKIILPWLQDELVPKGEDADEYVKKILAMKNS